jgi:hypothetical protein
LVRSNTAGEWCAATVAETAITIAHTHALTRLMPPPECRI